MVLNCTYSYSIHYVICYAFPAPAASQQSGTKLWRKLTLVPPPVRCVAWGDSPSPHASGSMGTQAGTAPLLSSSLTKITQSSFLTAGTQGTHRK